MTAPAGTTDGNTGTTEQQTGATPDESKLGDPGKAALEAERKAKRDAEKALRDALAELQTFKDRDKSEADKLAERATGAEDRATKAEAQLARLTIAVEKGLTPAEAARLQGATEDELRADADELLKLLGRDKSKTSDAPPKPPARPRERLRGGGDPTGGAMPLNGDPIEAALRAKLGIAES